MTIETVDVGWCKEITDQGATLIAQSSKSLRYLGLMRCDKVSCLSTFFPTYPRRLQLDIRFFFTTWVYICTHARTYVITGMHGKLPGFLN